MEWGGKEGCLVRVRYWPRGVRDEGNVVTIRISLPTSSYEITRSCFIVWKGEPEGHHWT